MDLGSRGIKCTIYLCGSLLSVFVVRGSLTFHLMFVHILLILFGLLSGHFSRKSCQVGWPRVLIVFCLFVILVISNFGFEGLIAPVPCHCLLVSFTGLDGCIEWWRETKSGGEFTGVSTIGVGKQQKKAIVKF